MLRGTRAEGLIGRRGSVSQGHIGSRLRSAICAILTVALVVMIAGCGASSSDDASGGASSQKVVIGTLATEDILPMWVAQDQGMFERAGLDVEIVTFQSATELIAAISSGSVDFAMTDPMVAARLCASGTDVRMEWVTLGTTASQGRFGIMTSADSGITSLSQLAGVPIGVGSNTILEYVTDRLLEQAGVPDDQIEIEELQKLPLRYQAMTSGQVQAAALPGSLLALGEAQGCVLLADDTQGDNISQSVMVVRTDYLESDGGEEMVTQLEGIWDQAVDLINADPESYRGILVQNANLSDEVADTYPISEYPHATRPTSDMVDPILEWMVEKGYLEQPLTYDPSTGAFVS